MTLFYKTLNRLFFIIFGTNITAGLKPLTLTWEGECSIPVLMLVDFISSQLKTLNIALIFVTIAKSRQLR